MDLRQESMGEKEKAARTRHESGNPAPNMLALVTPLSFVAVEINRVKFRNDSKDTAKDSRSSLAVPTEGRQPVQQQATFIGGGRDDGELASDFVVRLKAAKGKFFVRMRADTEADWNFTSTIEGEHEVRFAEKFFMSSRDW